jgi:cytochrome c-type biogenesis protein CcsB
MNAAAATPPSWKPTLVTDWLYAVVLVLGTLYVLQRFYAVMDYYEVSILLGTSVSLLGLGWYWKAVRWYLPVAVVTALVGIASYQGDLARAQQAFMLKYLVSSQAAIMWMCVLVYLSTGAYWLGLARRSNFAARSGTGLAWAATVMGLAGLLVRWYESYLITPGAGHIPVSNLYEVFVLFCLMTLWLHLYYEGRYATRQLGAFVLPVVGAAVAFTLWYSLEREAHKIQPLIPALQSWWMKIHVPANFVGYGAFALAAMLGIAWLLGSPRQQPEPPRQRLVLLLVSGTAVTIATVLYVLMGQGQLTGNDATGAGFVAKGLLATAVLCFVPLARGKLAALLPAPSVIEEIMYRAIALGFLFFTIATILGALWAADAWGGYWSWDPKETWALIVWLNYAAWLHIRLVKGWRGAVLAWWAIVGLFITTFAFLGVNMFLTGLHSYGAL